MIAIEITQPGGPEVLQPCQRNMPEPGTDEVLIRVEAAGVARADLLQRQGHYPPPPGASDIPGLDAAGVIEKTGSAVTDFQKGQRVCAILAGGGYAEYVAVPASQVLPTPENWSSVEAATLPENLFTVYDNMVTRARLRAGETILIHGGTSGIGTMAIMLARFVQSIPYVTVGSDAKRAAALELNAEAAINYNSENFAAAILRMTNGRGVDVILDMVGGSYLDRNLDALATEGRLTIIATQGGSQAPLDFRKLLNKRAQLMGSTMRSRSPQAKGAIRDLLLREIWPHLPGKQFIRPLIDRTFPLQDAAAAQARMEEGSHIGKIVLTV